MSELLNGLTLGAKPAHGACRQAIATALGLTLEVPGPEIALDLAPPRKSFPDGPRSRSRGQVAGCCG
ncbi:hypothetical protein GCM10023346_40900 [Arthrobacter gyeryongensis]|uniref:Uncharacterized protein n=1 Tax=Arthrobacter gyeryongensis TaxID=1650592 RepID=A0ABP9SSH8_9MICC